jgi:diguanylate cyclase (GGDEF)-like protein
MKLNFTDRLSFRLMVVCMGCALALGVILSAAQIAIDARRHSTEMDETMSQILTMLKQPATEAAYNIDPKLTQRVMDGLGKYQAVYEASIVLPPDEVLGALRREPDGSRLRFITDSIFGVERHFTIPLWVEGYTAAVGELRVKVDTYPAGKAFLDRALVVVLVGLMQSLILALVLFGIFFYLLTRPLLRMVETLAHVDPRAPQRVRLPRLPGHQRDELGVWVESANALLQSIEDHIAKRQEAEAKATYLQQFDRLTDLPNRTLFYDRVGQAIQRARRDGLKVGLLECDLRGFRFINDQHGNEAGDRLLREVSARFKTLIEERGTLARLSGDQFAVLLGELDRVETAAGIAQGLIDSLAEPCSVEGAAVKLDLAVGIAVYPVDAQVPEQLIQNAEQALGFAKLAGRNQYRFYVAELGERMRARQTMQQELEIALSRHQISIHYQPQFHARTGQLTAAEALLRWRHPEKGDIPPDVFIPLAEESGFINVLGEWVVAEACRRGKILQDAGTPLRISLNVSPAQFTGRPIHDVISQQLRESALPPELIEVELTETALMADLDQAIEVLKQLRILGVQVAVDDFGIGHSALSYLQRMPLSRLKIDRSFIHGIDAGTGGAQIVKAIINLSHGLDLEVVAEGVETRMQLEHLQAQGCDMIQGFLLSHPLAEPEFARFVGRMPSLDTDKLALFTGSSQQRQPAGRR